MYPLLDVKRDMYVLPNLIRYLSTYKFMSHIALIVQAHASLVLLLCLLSLSLSLSLSLPSLSLKERLDT